jgi:hypothetical protein
MATIDDPAHHPGDEDGRLERILRQDEWIEPPAAFAHRVMAAVRQEAALPSPLPFPWRRFLAGPAAGAVLIVAGTAVLWRSTAPLPLPAPPLASLGSLTLPVDLAPLAATAAALGWTAAALAGAYLLTQLARRLVRA